jgi:hypothetical protein
MTAHYPTFGCDYARLCPSGDINVGIKMLSLLTLGYLRGTVAFLPKNPFVVHVFYIRQGDCFAIKSEGESGFAPNRY